MSLKVVDKGYKKLLLNVSKKHPVITVGIHGEEGSAGHEGGSTVADIATVHEFGIGNHPARSFIRAWFDANRSKNLRTLRVMAESVVRGKNSPSVAAEKAALALENGSKGFVQGGNVSPATVKEEGGTTLIDSGHLVGSIRGKVDAK